MVSRPDWPPFGVRVTRATPGPEVRIGDAERNQVADALSEHFSAGRLDATELKERLDVAMGAKTRGELCGLLSDLPPLGAPPSEAPPRHRRIAMWLALGVLFLAVSLPWHAGPWPWAPRVPWLLIGLIALVVWGRSRRHFHRHPSG